MARCPYCKKILPDDWLKKEGASLMGKTRGATKARPATAKASSRSRWKRARKPAT